MTNVECAGNEAKIQNCKYQETPTSGCLSNHMAARVYCYEGPGNRAMRPCFVSYVILVSIANQMKLQIQTEILILFPDTNGNLDLIMGHHCTFVN